MKSAYTSDNYTNDNKNEKILTLHEKGKNNTNEIIKMKISKRGYLYNITEFSLDNNYTLKDALDILMTKLLHDNSDIKDKIDIGINDDDFFIGLEIINLINKNKNKNIVLKFFDFYPKGNACDNYFEIRHPNLKEFLDDILEDDSENKIIILPLNIGDHLGLFLVNNRQIHILDFGLYYIIDNNSLLIQQELNRCEENIDDIIAKKNFDALKIWEIIDKSENSNEIINELKSMAKIDDHDNLFKLIKKQKVLAKKLSDIKILKNNPRIDLNIFGNKELVQNIEILNVYNIQGSQSCGYFCLASLELLTNKEYEFKDIIKLLDEAIFHIKILKIICDSFIKDDRIIFKINEDISKEEYVIYSKKENKIGIKKNITELRIGEGCKNGHLLLNIDYVIDLKIIEQLLLEKGYKSDNFFI